MRLVYIEIVLQIVESRLLFLILSRKSYQAELNFSANIIIFEVSFYGSKNLNLYPSVVFYFII